MLRPNSGRFATNLLLFTDDTTLVADSDEKLCRLVRVNLVECSKRKKKVVRDYR